MEDKQLPARRQISRLETGVFIGLMLAAVIPYIDTVLHGYFLMDDFGALHLAKDFKLHRLFEPEFYNSYGTYGFFRPLGLLLWRVNYILYGYKPAGYFITNLLLHVVCTALVFLLTALLAGDRKTGLVAGLVFAVHPAHAEAINWLSCRYDLAATMFYLAGLLLYVKLERGHLRGWKIYCIILVTESSALMSKEMAATFPLALMLYALFYHEGGRAGLWRALLRTLPFLALAAAIVLLRAAIFHGMGGYGRHYSFVSVPEMAVRIRYYLLTLMFGFNLDYPYHVLAFGAVLTAAFVVALMGLCLSSHGRRKLALFFLCLTFLTCLPLINFSRITEKFFINSRYMYLPSFGYAAFLATALPVAGPVGRRMRALAVAGAAAVVVCYYGTLMNNNSVWVDKSSVSSTVLEQFKGFYPGSIDGFDITVINFPENIFGRNYFIPENLGYALLLEYGGKMRFTIESGQNMPGSPVKYSRKPRQGYVRKVVVAYDNDGRRAFPVYDSLVLERHGNGKDEGR